MRESSTYQMILNEGREEGLARGRDIGRSEGRQEGRQEGRNEGRQEGLIQGEQSALLILLQEKFGAMPPDIELRIRATTDPIQLQNAVKQVLYIASPGDLQL
jgi:predicted transposase YdaD